MRPPGYRLGTKGRRCGNCGAYRGRVSGRCTMFGVMVMAVRVCDRWYRAPGQRGKAA